MLIFQVARDKLGVVFSKFMALGAQLPNDEYCWCVYTMLFLVTLHVTAVKKKKKNVHY